MKTVVTDISSKGDVFLFLIYLFANNSRRHGKLIFSTEPDLMMAMKGLYVNFKRES